MDTTEHATEDFHPIEALRDLVPAGAVDAVRDLPARLRVELRDRPYRTLAVAVGLGVGVGALASSRITRFLVRNLGAFVLTELARRGAKQYLERAIAGA